MWIASLGIIQTIDLLRRKGLFLINFCCPLKADGESSFHTLVHCSFAWEVWFGILGDFRMRWVVPADLYSLLLSWKSKAFSARENQIWSLVPTMVCWSIWLERNRRISEGYAEPSFRVYQRAKDLIFLWPINVKIVIFYHHLSLREIGRGINGCNFLV